MEKALFNPGSDYDIVLREGDIVYIPEYVNTVKISGSGNRFHGADAWAAAERLPGKNCSVFK